MSWRSVPCGWTQMQVQQLPGHVQRLWPPRRACRAKYQTNDLESLFSQAREAPQITSLDPTPFDEQQQQQVLSWQRQRSQQPSTTEHKHSIDAADTLLASQPSAHHKNVLHQQPPLRNMLLRPSRMDFHTMFAQLQDWRQRHLTCHVPHHCFDAPELGAWVRYLRKQHKEGRLEQWKVDSLSQLEFEWQITDREARWHHLYHQLRRYRWLYGTSQVDPLRSKEDGCDWQLVAWWVTRQARLLAKQRLTAQQLAMLQQLGVCLTVSRQLVQRTAQLQGLNVHERRQLRKKWKLQDNMKHEEGRRQRLQELQKLLEQRQQQRQIQRRRQHLLQAAALAASKDVEAGAHRPEQHGKSTGQAKSAVLAAKQVRKIQQVSDSQRLQMQQPVERDSPLDWGGSKVLSSAASAEVSSADTSADACVTARGDARKQPQAGVLGVEPAADAAAPPLQQQLQQACEPPQQRQPQQACEPPQQQQLQKPDIAAEALLFRANCWRKRIRGKSRHERWLASEGG